MKTYCNPLDLPYRYQHMNEQGRRYAFRGGRPDACILQGNLLPVCLDVGGLFLFG